MKDVLINLNENNHDGQGFTPLKEIGHQEIKLEIEVEDTKFIQPNQDLLCADSMKDEIVDKALFATSEFDCALKGIKLDPLAFENFQVNSEDPHKEIREYECRRCFFIANSLGDLSKHAVIHRKRCNFQRTFQMPAFENVQVKAEYPDKKIEEFECSCCSFIDSSLKSLGKHKETHPLCHNFSKFNIEQHNVKTKTKLSSLNRKGKWYKCKHCEYETTKQLELTKHQKIQHAIEPPLYKCSYCPFTSLRKNIVGYHRNSHKLHKKRRTTKRHLLLRTNEVVLQSIRLKTQLVSHTGKKPCQTTPKNLPTLHKGRRTAQKPFKCKLCSFRAARRDNLTLHIRTHTGEKPYLCTICGYQTANQTHLKNHERNIHQGVPRRRYYCSLCDYSTIKKTLLMNHESKHSNSIICKKPSKREKSHKCSVCRFTTARRYSLTVHMRVHTGEKPYICTICPYQTAYSNHLKVHIKRVHLGISSRYQCAACSYSSTRKDLLKKHVLKHSVKTGV